MQNTFGYPRNNWADRDGKKHQIKGYRDAKQAGSSSLYYKFRKVPRRRRRCHAQNRLLRSCRLTQEGEIFRQCGSRDSTGRINFWGGCGKRCAHGARSRAP